MAISPGALYPFVYVILQFFEVPGLTHFCNLANIQVSVRSQSPPPFSASLLTELSSWSLPPNWVEVGVGITHSNAPIPSKEIILANFSLIGILKSSDTSFLELSYVLF